MSDLYACLGVKRGASTEEIRDAFKAQARVKHPDKGGDVEEFQAIQEAHEVLCDDERRRMYDLTGSVTNGDRMSGMAAGGIPFSFMQGGGPFGMPGVSFDMGNMFGNIFGGGGPTQRVQRRGGRGPNKHHDIGLRLSEFYKGHDIKLKFNQARRCTTCNGSGAEATEPCGPCSGAGMKTITRQIGPGLMAQTRAPCDACGGEGKRVIRVCKACQGKKISEKEKQLDIKLTPGMTDGEQLIYSGECSDSAEFDTPGNVVLTLRRADLSDTELDNFEWKGSDLWIRKQVTFAESILGFKRVLENHPAGNSPIVKWRGGPLIHGATLQIPGLGMPKKDGGFGNLLLQVMISAPPATAWSSEDAAKLHSVLGGASATLDEAGVQTLLIASAGSRLVIDKS